MSGETMRHVALRHEASAAAFERAKKVIPGGVDSPVRAYGPVGGTPPFIASGHGAHVRDIDGFDYVDLVGSWGPMIVGHADPHVVEAVRAVVGDSLSFGAPTEAEAVLAEEIIRRIDPVEKIRFVNSGTEATMSAIRLARGFTGRAKIVKFAGCYHGHVDALLAAAGSGLATLALPDSVGVPASVTADTLVLEYGDVGAVEAAFETYGEDIACIITEAAPANMGVVTPPEGFNATLARIAHAHGALFIVDEVLTGFRVGLRGGWGLEGNYTPDLMTFGKVIGGGMPVGAFGGRAEVMDMVAPLGPVYQAGTLSGNPVAMAAGLATLKLCDAGLYARLTAAADHVRASVGDALSQAGVPHCIESFGTLFSVFFANGSIRTYKDAKGQDTAAYAAFFHSMLDQGVYLPPSAFEAWFVSGAHDAEALARIDGALPAAAKAAAAVQAQTARSSLS